MRSTHKYKVVNAKETKRKLLSWAQQFEEVVWLDSNDYHQKYESYDAILAVDAFTLIRTDSELAFEQLKEYQSNTNDWIFGYLSYDLKNDIENLKSSNKDDLGFPELYFFQPKKIFLLKGNELQVRYLKMVDDEIDDDLKEIEEITIVDKITDKTAHKVKIKLRITKDVYIAKIEKLLKHIHRGDIYEANFCQEFYAENTTIDPLETFLHLNSISRPPFASYVKLEDQYILSATPERYIKKEGTEIISQPIKGTAKRAVDLEEDNEIKIALSEDPKERSENIMIVDLVRNDLSKTAVKGSVQVEELCKVYTFDQVHQMISTITSKSREKVTPVDIIKTTFPMGSMTGAPKISAMEIIENLEETKRGVYSGSIGYFTPENDFDFNVVIRSILYNQERKFISYSVGGAITSKSIPEKEYEECLLKAKAMREALEN